jgi:hypothetical protein
MAFSLVTGRVQRPGSDVRGGAAAASGVADIWPPAPTLLVAGALPSQNNWDYGAFGTSGTEFITMAPGDGVFDKKCAIGKACPMTIAVYGSVGGMYT